jgi:hypothetical protein
MSSNPADAAFGRKPHAPLSITVRLAALYAASAYIMLLATAGFLYWFLIQGLQRDDLYFLLDKVHRLEWALKRHADDPSFLEHEVKWEGGPHELEQSHAFYSHSR